MLRDFIAGVSGATLGYIHGNTKGAIKGFALAHKLANRSRDMAPIPRKRKHQFLAGTRRRAAALSKRIKTSHVVYTRRANRKRSKRLRGARKNNVTDTGMVIFKKKKGIDFKRPKKVKVSKTFKTKVHKAMSELPEGYYQKISAQLLQMPTSSDQMAVNIGAGEFSPIRFAEAACVLFRNMTPVLNPSTASPGLYTTLYQVKLYVKKCWTTYEFRNNSQRNYYMTIYICKPKSNQAQGQSLDALTEWSRGLLGMLGAGTNPQGVTVNTLKADPKSVYQFNMNWKAEKVQVCLRPGETYKHYLEGPSDLTLNFQKLYRTTTTGPDFLLLDYAKFTRDVFVTMYPDLVDTTLVGVGRLTDANVNSAGSVICERNQYFKLECPEEAGFQYPGGVYPAGAVQDLNFRRDIYVVKNFNPNNGSLTGVITRVDEENPQTIETDPTN